MRIPLLPRLPGALRTLWRAIAFPAVIVTSAVVTACGGDSNFLSPAFVENAERQYSVWALSGTAAALPSGYQFTTESLVRPQVLGGGSINFDVAFDLTADGKVLVLPARLVVPLPPGGAPPVGVQRWPAAFEQLQRASDRDYVVDTALVLSVGETMMVQLANTGCTFGDPFYAKLTVDDIDLPNRRIFIRSLVNRNCGYRALTVGVPTN